MAYGLAPLDPSMIKISGSGNDASLGHIKTPG
jgi:hypothetical protein